MMYDIHCHLHLLKDPKAAVLRAKAAGVKKIVTNGLDNYSNQESLRLAKKFDIVEAALGLYPTDAVKLPAGEVNKIIDDIKKARPVAIGEVGLDYYHDTSDIPRMKEIFSEVLSLAEDIKRPLIIHSRKAEKDVIELLSSYDVRADLHCFGGSLKLARKASDMGCFFSIPTSIIRATHFQRLSEEIPLSQLLTETDSPFMSPSVNPNEPANIPVVVDKIANIKGMLREECAYALWMNQERFLR